MGNFFHSKQFFFYIIHGMILHSPSKEVPMQKPASWNVYPSPWIAQKHGDKL